MCHVRLPPSLPPSLSPSLTAPLVVDGEAEVEHLLATEPGVNWPQGVAIITEPLLGSTLVCLTSDLQCVCYPIPAGARWVCLSLDQPLLPATLSPSPVVILQVTWTIV